MNGITLTLRALHQGERQLAEELAAVAERHSVEHEVRHVAKDLVTWSDEHCVRLAETAAHYGLRLDGPACKPSSGFMPTLREKSAEAMARRPEPGLLLLKDLRELNLGATENSLYWEMLTQAAKSGKNTRLLQLARSCHPQTLRQIRWTNTTLKNMAPQILTSL
ncbi:hypothetical protein PZ61_0202980 [Streptomyces sp. MNU77]|uniref:hypothetical protein n=1 Tax=Streptomyces sp. MNU77 TaxID=1573406 RepID=UPI0005E44B49|nr:hypothetical protein [Streptomyces sp. MNU77]OLO29558.1 hypothetical protein PZ61_0202980 [Streptomyces sp. MNU77]